MNINFNQKQMPPRPQNPFEKKSDETGGPKDLTETVKRPNSKGILDRMKNIDPDIAKRYRQRSGQ